MSLCFLPFRKYADFTGRAGRREYWSFFLLTLLPAVALLTAAELSGSLAVSLAATSYFLATFLPSLAVSVRRLHDSGKSGWWILMGFLGPAGWLVYLGFMLRKSGLGDNRYGRHPKAAPIPVREAPWPPASSMPRTDGA
ncbi:DUF805 domain-containing protein [Streptomyces sp. CMB-StM0423]|uniref:DUF805 domain-containing protein n=1 Tax=Streptomyces sp. CMB-StM0423 TaxID=2059884 RepID=UPI00131C90A6|nr:DUF805 domain-containing protein [Streptomyces sp. CMB-StM0423]